MGCSEPIVVKVLVFINTDFKGFSIGGIGSSGVQYYRKVVLME
jgi:hypothetical protein